MFCCYFYKIFEDTCNTENLRMIASEKLDIISSDFKYYWRKDA